MKKHISFPSIEPFRRIYETIKRRTTFIGLDDNGNPMYDETKKLPTLTFEGTIKLHVTNAGVCYNEIDGIWAQSRENIVTIAEDNAGFAFFVETKKEQFHKLFMELKSKYQINCQSNTISIFGEWAGSGIQKGVTPLI